MILSNLKIISLVLLISFENHLCLCGSDDFQSSVDGFIEAFDNAYSAEVHTPREDDLSVGNEVIEGESFSPDETKQNEEKPVEEPSFVSESSWEPGSEVKHEVTEDVIALAEKAVQAISSRLRLENVTKATSMVTDKIQRSLSVVVARKDCEDSSCTMSCQVELSSNGSVDVVTWHNCLDSKDMNEVTREKRGAIGGFKEVDDKEAKELADVALQTLDSIDADDTKRVVTQVIHARKQLVNGIMYHLTLEVATSDCKEDEEKCHGKLNDHNICKILMQRLFSGDAPHNAQVIKSECTPISKGKEVDSRMIQKRVRRVVTTDDVETNMISDHISEKKTRSHSRIVGGKTKQDPESDKIKEISEFALAEIDKSSNSLNKQKIIRVVDARTQVVAGVKYFLKLELVETNCRKGSNEAICNPINNQVLQSCEVSVWDKPWEKFRAVTSVNCSPTQSRRKRALVGGKHPADTNDLKVQEIAQFVVSELNKRSNSIKEQKLLIVKEAQTQVVAGANYFLTIQLVETNCRKGSKPDASCSSGPFKEIQECAVVVYDRPWDKHREMTSANCSTVPSAHVKKRQVTVGVRCNKDKDSEDVQDMAQFAVEDLNKKSNSLYKHKLVDVVSAETQVVSGVNFYLKMRVIETNCKKNSNDSQENCIPKKTEYPKECNVSIWSKPWMSERLVTKSVCKKQNAGEPKVADPLTPEVLEAARFSLQAIDRASNSMYKHALIRVVDASVQTVSGKKYFLTLEIGESECTKNHNKENCAIRAENSLNEKCKVVVWDKKWLNKKDVLDVQCGLRRKRSLVSIPQNINDLRLTMFQQFKIKYNKMYADEAEHNKRFRIFKANLKKIQAFQENEQGTAVYGPNMLADLTAKEFKQKYLGLKPGPGPKPSKHHMKPAQIPNVEPPTDFDWRDHNAVTPVKNQGQCGSCWAFSVTGNVEGQHFLKHSKLLSLSEQELVDCDKTDNGCNGGYMTSAYEAIEKLGGLETEDEYPYDAQDESCKFNQSEAQVKVTSSVNITTNETQMAQWLFANGPISIGINANAMQFYMGGVSHPFKFLCNKNDLDHGVLLVGFGVHRTSIRHKLLPYWLIKNSWGPHWGEKGYYRVYRGDGTCGVNQMASSAIVE